jgi:hypothetical protein|tara:strand:- start:172 stop:570 length:399 start_codon:yes stop_codon:yes gene_type:complete
MVLKEKEENLIKVSIKKTLLPDRNLEALYLSHEDKEAGEWGEKISFEKWKKKYPTLIYEIPVSNELKKYLKEDKEIKSGVLISSTKALEMVNGMSGLKPIPDYLIGLIKDLALYSSQQKGWSKQKKILKVEY